MKSEKIRIVLNQFFAFYTFQINQETQDYIKNRDEVFHKEIEKEMVEKFKLVEEDLQRKALQVEKYREEEERLII